jgi:hypothetical protein
MSSSGQRAARPFARTDAGLPFQEGIRQLADRCPDRERGADTERSDGAVIKDGDTPDIAVQNVFL